MIQGRVTSFSQDRLRDDMTIVVAKVISPPDGDDQARAIVDSALGNVPCVCPVRRPAR